MQGEWDDNKILLFFFICRNLQTKETGTLLMRMDGGWMDGMTECDLTLALDKI